MANVSVTWTFTNGTTSDATQVNTNFTDIINGLSDGTKDLHIAALNTEGACTFDGAVTLGDASADDITFNGSLASSVPVKANATYNIGGATTGLLSTYYGNGSYTTRILAGTLTESYTLTLPVASPGYAGKTLIFSSTGAAEFRYADKYTAVKTTTYAATGDETIIPCNPTTGGASFTVSLPAASTMTGKRLTIIKLDSDTSKTVTIDPNSSETINGATTYILYTQYESVTIVCDGTAWYVMDHFAETDWSTASSATLTMTTGVRGTSTESIGWRRRGRSAHIRFKYNQTVAGTNATDTIRITIPSIGTIDTAITGTNTNTNTNNEGAPATVLSAASGNLGTGSGGTGVCSIYSTTQFRIYYNILGVSVGAWGTGIYNLGNTTVNVECELEVPISGWNP